MKRDYPDRPIVGVGGVVINDGRALVVKRAAEPLRGEWSVPGGAVEVGETLRQATAREVFEETGLIVEACELLDVFDSIFRDTGDRILYHFALVDFRCRLLDGKLQAASDVSEVRWVSLSELPSLQMTKATEGLLRKALQGN
ncbi:MAG: NUDIX hydrolase [Terriglobales bacterium]|jgi:mutator protein MutT